MGSAHVVGVVWPGASCRWHRGTPAVAVNLVVVGVSVVEVRIVEVAGEGVVGRHSPVEVGRCHGAAEAQVLGCAVHAVAVGVVEPDAGKVDRHIDFFARVGIIAIEPYFVVFAVDGLGPYLVDDYVCGQFVFISAVDHQFGLCVQGGGHTFGLWTCKVAD